MSDREIRLLEQIYAEWGRGDYSRGDFLHPDIEMRLTDDFLDTTGVYKGVREVWRGWRAWIDQWESWEYTPTRMMELGNGRIVAFIDLHGIGRTGLEVESSGGNVWEFEGGLVKRLTVYAHREEMLRELGLEDS